jgi:hypothetical protein
MGKNKHKHNAQTLFSTWVKFITLTISAGGMQTIRAIIEM